LTLNHNKQFAETLRSLISDFPMDAPEIENLIRTIGFDDFISVANHYDPGISEVAELLIRHGKGGAPDGEG
jgi:hypothetical protein